MWFIWPWALLPKKKISKKFDIGLLLNQNCLGSLTKTIFSPSAVSMKIRLLHPVEQDYLDPLYLLVSFKEHCSSIPVSISAVYRCLECLPFWCYFRRSAFHTKSYSKDPKIVPAKNVRFSVISHHKRVKLQDFANVQNRKRSSFGWRTTSGNSGSCSHVWLCSSRWRSRSSSRFT